MSATPEFQSAASSFFTDDLSISDPDMAGIISREEVRQRDQIELIASENIVSRAVLEAQGSVLTNKYAEGYPGRRYYGGCEVVDEAEELAINRAKKLFDCEEALVQPHSGSQANQTVFMSLMKPGDAFLGLDLAAGGHLTHGSKVNQSGKWFDAHHYTVDPETHIIDMDEVGRLADEVKPKMIVAGGSAYARTLDFKAFREIADRVGAYLMVDMAHIAGLVAAGEHPSPLPYAHAVTSTTHKTLRGPRGGLVLTNDKDLAKKFRSALFPGLQGGPLMHVVAAKAVAFGEALQPQFKEYIRQVVKNADVLANTLIEAGYAVVSGGTDTHLALIDLRPKGVKGNAAEEALERAHITTNKNGVPNDPEKPAITSGIRVGSPAATSRGFGEAEFAETGRLMARVLDALAEGGDTSAVEQEVAGEVKKLLTRFPIY
ncbi:serine hydroxymethyltransferase [Parvularcula marina]|uniref:Serine hydroxymethyltransferase n=1 Tax=Parvularcula marina TaxID=2292771 RepID=A0A371RL66_9PROT|nr:serine hydroxymethyltransferase [Parvularcula marina]RFB06195.1 serine hydroxymethyltransferase [Parvularcula marina]